MGILFKKKNKDTTFIEMDFETKKWIEETIKFYVRNRFDEDFKPLSEEEVKGYRQIQNYTFKSFVQQLITKKLEEISNSIEEDIKNIFETEINRESFIDNIVSRIKRKQI